MSGRLEMLDVARPTMEVTISVAASDTYDVVRTIESYRALAHKLVDILDTQGVRHRLKARIVVAGHTIEVEL